LLGDTVAGVVTRLPGGQLRFDYEDGYRDRSDETPISVSMPTRIRSHPDAVITPWLWNLLPDNGAVLDRWARQFHASASSPFSLLATPAGRDCAGAVRFTSPDLVDETIGRPGEIVWLTEDEIAERLRDLKNDSTAWLGRSFTGQFSLAGAQPKTALLRRGDRWGGPLWKGRDYTHPEAIGGTDAHAKNYSLLLAGTQVRLAPLYDVASALPCGMHERKLKLAMKVGGSYSVFPFQNTWGRAAGEMGIDPHAALDRVRDLTGRVAEAFAEAAAAPDVVALGRHLPGRLADIIADRAVRCARVVGSAAGPVTPASR
jgi:HipA-like protein